MNATEFHFPEVTLLVTHYNRSSSLRRLLESLAELGCTFGGIVVSDDGSRPEHRQAVEALEGQYGFRLVTTPRNQGLGHNLNKGQDAVSTPYTLYVQEDFVPAPAFPATFRNALGIMRRESDLDIVRFYAYLRYPYLKPYGQGFSEMVIRPWYFKYKKIYYYSDHPHLRRSTFPDKFGRYAEGIKTDKTEYRMCISFIRQGGRGLFYDDFQGLFAQVNPDEEPSTVKRSRWTESRNLLIVAARDAYRQVKYNYDIHFLKLM